MFDKNLIQQVQMLRVLKPSSEWKSRTKDILLSQMRSQGSNSEIVVPIKQRIVVYCMESVRTAYQTTFGVVFARPAHLAMALSIVIAVGGGMVFVAEKSLPGDPLYAVKQTREEVGMAFVSPDGRAEAELERVARRLDEIRALKYAPLSDQEKEHQVGMVIDTLSQNFSTVQKNLENISEPSKAISAADTIKQKTSSTRQELGALKLSDQMDGKLASAQSAIRQTDQKALEVIVDKGGSAGLTDAAIATRLIEETRVLTNKLNSLEMKVTLATVSQSSDREELLNKKQEAQKRLAEASEQIEKKDFKLAIEKLNQSKEIAVVLEALLKDVAGTSGGNDSRMK